MEKITKTIEINLSEFTTDSLINEIINRQLTETQKERLTAPKKTKEQEMEELFLSIINSCEKVKEGNSIFYKKDKKIFAEEDEKNKIFWVKYLNFWEVFETKFDLNYSQTQAFMQIMLEAHLKLNGFTPYFIPTLFYQSWKRI